ncbi:hypothetical protein QR680_018591 [Steinernema hermaphroditum]|uniref:Uncharacterized protein n=1 Tax=Steinernema hermaphroditum TaxID=289476 RepID=A0AA39HKJ2_9BILA|nr:hypothetical protein QR680_018591 [Steinernema hermaphroditum]
MPSFWYSWILNSGLSHFLGYALSIIYKKRKCGFTRLVDITKNTSPKKGIPHTAIKKHSKNNEHVYDVHREIMKKNRLANGRTGRLLESFWEAFPYRRRESK